MYIKQEQGSHGLFVSAWYTDNNKKIWTAVVIAVICIYNISVLFIDQLIVEINEFK